MYLDGAVVVSAVTLGELAYGIGTGDRDAREQRLRRVLTATKSCLSGSRRPSSMACSLSSSGSPAATRAHAGSICRSLQQRRPGRLPLLTDEPGRFRRRRDTGRRRTDPPIGLTSRPSAVPARSPACCAARSMCGVGEPRAESSRGVRCSPVATWGSLLRQAAEAGLKLLTQSTQQRERTPQRRRRSRPARPGRRRARVRPAVAPAPTGGRARPARRLRTRSRRRRRPG